MERLFEFFFIFRQRELNFIVSGRGRERERDKEGNCRGGSETVVPRCSKERERADLGLLSRVQIGILKRRPRELTTELAAYNFRRPLRSAATHLAVSSEPRCHCRCEKEELLLEANWLRLSSFPRLTRIAEGVEIRARGKAGACLSFSLLLLALNGERTSRERKRIKAGFSEERSEPIEGKRKKGKNVSSSGGG